MGLGMRQNSNRARINKTVEICKELFFRTVEGLY